MLIVAIILGIFLGLSTIAICFFCNFDKTEVIGLMLFIYLFPIWVIVKTVFYIKGKSERQKIIKKRKEMRLDDED